MCFCSIFPPAFNLFSSCHKHNSPHRDIVSWYLHMAFQTVVSVGVPWSLERNYDSDPHWQITFHIANWQITLAVVSYSNEHKRLWDCMCLVVFFPERCSSVSFFSRCVPHVTDRVLLSAVMWRLAGERITITVLWRTKPKSKRIPHKGFICKSLCLWTLHTFIHNK